MFDATLQAKRRVLGDGLASTLYNISYLGFVCQRQSKYRLVGASSGGPRQPPFEHFRQLS